MNLAIKMNLRIIRKNHAADPEIEFLKKSISKPYGRATAMPTAWGINWVTGVQNLMQSHGLSI